MKKFLYIFLLSFFMGCASVTVQKYNNAVYPKTNPQSIIVFFDKPADKDFKELGEITVIDASNWEQIKKIFRKKASDMGADAVYLFSKQEELRQSVFPDECYGYDAYYYPYYRYGWRPRGRHNYCFGYIPTINTTAFISAVGIAIKYDQPKIN